METNKQTALKQLLAQARRTTLEKIHRFSLYVCFGDTDAGGFVYHASYLRLAEQARMALLRDIQYDMNKMVENDHAMLIAFHCSCDYLKPAYYNEELIIESQIKEITRVKIEMLQNIILAKDQSLSARLHIKMGCISPQTKRPTRLPEAFLRAISSISS